MTDRPVSGKWFEELTEGLVMQHVIRRTITEADNIGFTTMTMNPAWLHLDADYAANETEFGKPLVNSLLTLSLAVGISVHETTLGTTVANLGFEESIFPAPVFHGDTIRVETEVLKRRASSSRPNQVSSASSCNTPSFCALDNSARARSRGPAHIDRPTRLKRHLSDHRDAASTWSAVQLVSCTAYPCGVASELPTVMLQGCPHRTSSKGTRPVAHRSSL